MIGQISLCMALGLALVASRADAIQYQIDFRGNINVWGGIPTGNVGPYGIPGPPSPGPPPVAKSTFTGSFVFDPATPPSHFLTTPNQQGYQHSLLGGFQLSVPDANSGAGVNFVADEYVVEVVNDFNFFGTPTDILVVEFNTSLTPAPTSDLLINGTPYNGFFGLPTTAPTGHVKLDFALTDNAFFDTNTLLPSALLLPNQFDIVKSSGIINDTPPVGLDVSLGSVQVTSVSETFISPPPAPVPEPAAWQLWLIGVVGMLLYSLWRQREFRRKTTTAAK